MHDRYDGRPLVRLLEYYFLWCIGALSSEFEAALDRYAPTLSKILGHKGTWYEVLEAAVELPPDIRERTAQVWKRHLGDSELNGSRYTAQEAAEQFVDENFDIEPADESWPPIN